MQNNVDKKEIPKNNKNNNADVFSQVEQLFNYEIGQTINYAVTKHNPYRNISEQVILTDTIVGTILHRDSLGYSILYNVANSKDFVNQKDVIEVVFSGKCSNKK